MTEQEALEADRAFYRDALHSMIRVGVNMANILELRAVNGTMEGENAVIDASIAFDRVARAVRRSIMLATQLSEPERAKPHVAKAEPKQPEPKQPEPKPPAQTRTANPSPERLDRDRPEQFPEPVAETLPETLVDGSERQDATTGLQEPGDAPDGALCQQSIPAQIAALSRELDECQDLPILAQPLPIPGLPRRPSG